MNLNVGIETLGMWHWSYYNWRMNGMSYTITQHFRELSQKLETLSSLAHNRNYKTDSTIRRTRKQIHKVVYVINNKGFRITWS